MNSFLPCWNSGTEECKIKLAYMLQPLKQLFLKIEIISDLFFEEKKKKKSGTESYKKFWIGFCGQQLKQLNTIKNPVKFFFESSDSSCVRACARAAAA